MGMGADNCRIGTDRLTGWKALSGWTQAWNCCCWAGGQPKDSGKGRAWGTAPVGTVSRRASNPFGTCPGHPSSRPMDSNWKGGAKVFCATELPPKANRCQQFHQIAIQSLFLALLTDCLSAASECFAQCVERLAKPGCPVGTALEDCAGNVMMGMECIWRVEGTLTRRHGQVLARALGNC